MRYCSNCGSDTTYIHTKKQIPVWYKYKDGYICHRCYMKLIMDPKRSDIKIKKYNPRRLKYKGKYIYVEEPPRKGVCQLCGAIKGIDCNQTQMHHFAEYHDDDPLKDTIEVCASCHRIEHKK